MKKSTKKLLSLLLIASLILGLSGFLSLKSEAGSTYWMVGFGKACGSGYNSKCILKNNSKFKIKGKWGKNKSDSKAYKQAAKKKGKTYNKSIKIASNCKITEMADEVYTKHFDPTVYNNGDNFSQLVCYLKIKNGKVVEIIQSA